MDYCMYLVELVVSSLKRMKQSYIQELQKGPDGGLICNLSHKRNRFYHATTQNGRYRRKYLSPLVSDDSLMISRLARKEYLKKSLPLLDRNISQLEKALSRYSPIDPGSIVENMKNAYRFLDADRFFETADAESLKSQILHELSVHENMGTLFSEEDEYLALRMNDHRRCAEEPYKRNDHPFGDEMIFTSDGTRTRSRAEAVWYDKLRQFDVPFKFDKLTYLGDNPETGFWQAPDFTFEDAHYDEFYLEYCGMMDNPDYVAGHMIKRAKYESAGVFPWKNIIYDYAEKTLLT